MPRAVVLALSSVLLALLAVQPARAHDVLQETSPQDGAQLTEAPEELVLTYSGQISDLGTQVQVTGPQGPATDGEPEVQGREVVQPLADELPAGDYEVAWRVTSSDGHPISGTLGFTVTEDTPADTAPATTAPVTSAPAGTGDSATQQPADAAPTTPAPPATPATEQAQDDQDQQEGSGIPAWGWVVAALALLAALGAGLALRRR